MRKPSATSPQPVRDLLVRRLRVGQLRAVAARAARARAGVWIPDLLVAPEDLEPYADEDGLGVDAAAVRLVVEVVSPRKRNQDRDRVRKRREYARAGIPVHVIIDDYDNNGTVTLLTEPQPDEADWLGVVRAPYGTEVVIPKGPAKGFVIGEAITGPKRG